MLGKTGIIVPGQKMKKIIDSDYNCYLNTQIRQSAETRKYPEYQRRCKDAVLECSKLWRPNSKVLEIGCGDGFSLDWLRKLKFDCYGVDINPEKIETARQHGHNNVYCIDAIDLPFEDNSFDVVYSRHTLEHILKPEPMLQEIHRVLNSLGRFSLIVPIVLPGRVNFNKKHVIAVSNKEYVAELLEAYNFVVDRNEEKDMPGGREVWTLAFVDK